MTPRTGRPTDNPKTYRVGVRLDDATKRVLDLYCAQKKVNPTEAVRQGILRLASELERE
jgi:hypothetical protein